MASVGGPVSGLGGRVGNSRTGESSGKQPRSTFNSRGAFYVFLFCLTCSLAIFFLGGGFVHKSAVLG